MKLHKGLASQYIEVQQEVEQRFERMIESKLAEVDQKMETIESFVRMIVEDEMARQVNKNEQET